MSSREVVNSILAPAAIGPYSQAIKANGLVFCSGCLGIVPETKSLISDDVGAQARQALTNIKNILEEAGSDLSKVVKCTVLLRDMAMFAEVNAVYSEFFPSNPPARMTYAVSGLPLNALVEIDAISIA